MNTNTAVTIVGAGGTMAGHYIPKIISIMSRLEPSKPALILIENDRAKHESLRTRFDAREVAATVGEIQSPGKVAFVLSNTPAHCQNVLDLMDLGYTSIFVEKPTVMNGHEMKKIGDRLKDFQRLDQPLPVVYTAYLMKFSGAVAALKDVMGQQGLLPCEIDVEWGKNRTMDKRPTAGNVLDEAVHGYGISLDLIGSCVRDPFDLGIHLLSLIVRQQKFADEAAQIEANARDALFPLKPSSSTRILLDVVSKVPYLETRDTADPIQWSTVVSLRSSFTRISQERVVRGVCSSRQQSSLVMFEIYFDQKDEQGVHDKLLVQKAGDKCPFIDQKFHSDKLLSETEAFLALSFKERRDSRLTELSEAWRIQSFFQECPSEASVDKAKTFC